MRRILLAALVAVFVVPPGLAWSVLYTETGARWVLDQVRAATNDAFTWRGAEGSLAGGLELEVVSFSNDGVSVTSTGDSLSIDIDLFPLGINVVGARVDALDVELRTTVDDERADVADLAGLLENLALPVALVVEDLAIGPTRISRNGETLAEVEGLRLDANWHERIEIGGLDVDGPGLSAGLSGELDLVSPFAMSGSLKVDADQSITQLPDPVSVSAAFSGDAERLEIELDESTFGLAIAGDLERMLHEARRWNLEVSVPRWSHPDSGVEIVEAVASSAGWLDDYTLVTSLTLVSPEQVAVRLDGAGSLVGLDVSSLALEHAAGTMLVSGRLDFPATFLGSVRTGGFDPAQLTSAWPAGVPVELSASVDASPTSIALADGSLAAGDARGRFDARFDPVASRFDATLAWQSLRWPLTGKPSLDSREGSITVRGGVDDWMAEAALALASPGLAEGRFRVDARGTSTRADFDIVEGDVLGGSIDGMAAIDWGPAASWRAELNVRDVTTGALLPAFPGTLSTRASAKSVDGLASARLEIEELTGSILEEPLSGSGAIEVSGERLVADGFSMRHGETRIDIDGDVASPDGVRFEFESNRLADYIAGLAGDIEAQGSLSRTTERTELNLTALVGSLRYDNISALNSVIEIAATTDGGHSVMVRAGSATVAERRIERIGLDVLLEPDRQRLDLSFEPLAYAVDLQLDGALDNWAEPFASTWRGRLTRLNLRTPDAAEGALTEPAELVLSPESVVLDKACVDGSRGAKICAGLHWMKNGDMGLSGDADSLPLDIINAFAKTGFDFTQKLTGSVEWQKRAERGATGFVDVRLTGGQITSESFPDLDLETDAGGLAFEVEDGQLLEGNLDLPLPGTGFVNGWFLVDDISEGTASTVEGSLDARINDIEVLAVFVPNIDDAAGQISANLELDGTLAEPLFRGRAALTNGSLDYFPLGLVLEDIDLTGTMNERQGIDLAGRFRAGDGVASIRTSRESSEDREPGIHFEIDGTNLTLIDLPDVTARADTNLELDLTEGRLDIAGSIDVPFARIRPRNLTSTRIDESDDVVIVAGELPGLENEVEERRDLEFFGSLAFRLGNDVQVDVDVANASLTGAADFEWTGDPIPTGTGRYDLAGTVEAFGQVLDITEGIIRFPGVPADNPNLRIRATREIFGNSQVKRAGILVSGSAQRPTVETYTNPATTEERALTLLITGNDFDFEQGVGAIDFGTYIAPRLFLSYGIGVFTQENIVSARYDLTTGWGVRISSGAKDSGMDMTYRIEN